MKKIVYSILSLCLLLGSLSACGQAKEESAANAPIPDGVYTAVFTTDNSMFHINEAYDNRGVLTVADGAMTMHIILPSKNILHLYPGLAEDAQREGAALLDPSEESVTYADGMTETVYAYDIPVPVLEEEFDLALVGTKGTWYDHKVSVSDPQPVGTEEAALTESTADATEAAAAESAADAVGAALTESAADTAGAAAAESAADAAAAGAYTIELSIEGGSGRASVASPAQLTVTEDGMLLRLEWSSPNYDYMLLDGEKYLPVNTEGNSVFELPIRTVDEPLDVIADTTAMSEPHEVAYTLRFDAASLRTE